MWICRRSTASRCSHVSSAAAAIPVIMLTNRDHVSSVERAIELGVDGYLPKQDMLHQLCTIVRQFLDAQV
jgi:DNA-binding NarL/FixJ family response regulator